MIDLNDLDGMNDEDLADRLYRLAKTMGTEEAAEMGALRTAEELKAKIVEYELEVVAVEDRRESDASLRRAKQEVKRLSDRYTPEIKRLRAGQRLAGLLLQENFGEDADS